MTSLIYVYKNYTLYPSCISSYKNNYDYDNKSSFDMLNINQVKTIYILVYLNCIRYFTFPHLIYIFDCSAFYCKISYSALCSDFKPCCIAYHNAHHEI